MLNWIILGIIAVVILFSSHKAINIIKEVAMLYKEEEGEDYYT